MSLITARVTGAGPTDGPRAVHKQFETACTARFGANKDAPLEKPNLISPARHNSIFNSKISFDLLI